MRSIASSRTSAALERPAAPEPLLRSAILLAVCAWMLLATAHALAGFDALAHAAWLPGCAFRALFQIPCPGCGMTRALLLLAELRFADSFAAHPAALPLLAAATTWALRPEWLRPLRRTAVESALLAGLLALWMIRVLPTI